jgi:glyoxylase-like metal-dependent hydrolase (beta-lactamase superfamily II)
MLKKLGDITLIQLSSSDSNIYVIGDTVIDAGTGFNFTRLRDALRVLKKDLGDIKEVVNTHGHFDHCGGNGYFLNAKTAIHEADAPIVENGDAEASVADFFEGSPKPHEIQRKLNEGDVINAGSHELEVIHTPGHTPGSICLYDRKTGTLFSGDTVFSEGVGRTDLPGGDPVAFAASIQKLRELKVKRILPGHGDPVIANADKVLSNAAEMANYV